MPPRRQACACAEAARATKHAAAATAAAAARGKYVVAGSAAQIKYDPRRGSMTPLPLVV